MERVGASILTLVWTIPDPAHRPPRRRVKGALHSRGERRRPAIGHWVSQGF